MTIKSLIFDLVAFKIKAFVFGHSHMNIGCCGVRERLYLVSLKVFVMSTTLAVSHHKEIISSFSRSLIGLILPML